MPVVALAATYVTMFLAFGRAAFALTLPYILSMVRGGGICSLPNTVENGD